MQREQKKRGEDWIFEFYLRNESDQLIDLFWYKYSIVIEKKWWAEILRESWDITSHWEELIKVIPGSETQSQVGIFQIEYKIEDINWNTFITDKVEFESINTLHFN